MDSKLGGVSSWSAYDSQRRRQRKGGPNDAAAAAASRTSSNVSPTPTPTGIAALYHPAPAGIDTRLQFQWMRVHPATAFLAASSSNEASTASRGDSSSSSSAAAFESAHLVDRYLEAKFGAAGSSSSGRKRPRPNIDGDSSSSLVTKPDGVTVDLTSLIDPPLLSEWLPGADTTISYGTDSSDDGSDDEAVQDGGATGAQCGAANAGGPDLTKVNAAIDRLVKAASAGEALAGEGDHDVNGTTIDDENVWSLKDLSSEVLMKVLPSRTVLKRIENLLQGSGKGGGARPNRYCIYTTSIAFLRLLAETCPSEAIGRHTLSTLAPILLTRVESTVTGVDDGAAVTEYRITLSQSDGIRALADALVSRCGLVNLSRVELLQLTEGINQHHQQDGIEARTELVEELGMALGEAYFRWRKKG